MLIEAPKSKFRRLVCEFLQHDYGDEKLELVNILVVGRADLGIKSQQYSRYCITQECSRCGQVVGSFIGVG